MLNAGRNDLLHGDLRSVSHERNSSNDSHEKDFLFAPRQRRTLRDNKNFMKHFPTNIENANKIFP